MKNNFFKSSFISYATTYRTQLIIRNIKRIIFFLYKSKHDPNVPWVYPVRVVLWQNLQFKLLLYCRFNWHHILKLFKSNLAWFFVFIGSCPLLILFYQWDIIHQIFWPALSKLNTICLWQLNMKYGNTICY